MNKLRGPVALTISSGLLLYGCGEISNNHMDAVAEAHQQRLDTIGQAAAHTIVEQVVEQGEHDQRANKLGTIAGKLLDSSNAPTIGDLTMSGTDGEGNSVSIGFRGQERDADNVAFIDVNKLNPASCVFDVLRGMRCKEQTTTIVKSAAGHYTFTKAVMLADEDQSTRFAVAGGSEMQLLQPHVVRTAQKIEDRTLDNLDFVAQQT